MNEILNQEDDAIRLAKVADGVAAALNGSSTAANSPWARPQHVSRPPFPFRMVDDLDPAPRKDWVVKGFLGAGEFSVVYGDPGCGKSVLATDAAFHVASDMEWIGRGVRGGAVLYVAAERAALTERRLVALRTKHELANVKLAILDGRFDLFNDGGDAARLIATANAVSDAVGVPVVLIIVDTVARVIPGADENHSRDVGRFIANIDEVRAATGAHVMAIHHAGKDKSRGMRGSTALLGAADTTIFVEKLESGRFATVDKSNDVGEGEAIAFTLESVELSTDPETGEATTAPVVVANADAPSPRPRAKPDGLTPVERTVLACLHKAVDDQGKPPPAGDPGIPPSVLRVVDESAWRDEVYLKTRSVDEDESAARKRFNRAREKLVDRKKVGKSGFNVWPAS